MYANVIFVWIPKWFWDPRILVYYYISFHLPHPVPQFPMGFSVAASVRVGNALGAGDTERAKLSSKVSLIFACMNQTRRLTNLQKGAVLSYVCSSDWQTKSFSKSWAMFGHLNLPAEGVLFSLSLVEANSRYAFIYLPPLSNNVLCFLCPI